MDREALHATADELISDKRFTTSCIVHCLIDLGLVTSLECAYKDCDLPSRKFSKDSTRFQRDHLDLDHKVSRSGGGSHRPENIQIMHHRCNIRKGASGEAKEARRQRLTEALRQRWQDPEYREKMSESSRNVSQEARDRRAQKMRDHHADPAYKEKVSAAGREGWKKRRKNQCQSSS
jgi:hypothetical protein